MPWKLRKKKSAIRPSPSATRWAVTSLEFKMFSGFEENVMLEFDNDLICVLYGKFGEQIKMKCIEECTRSALMQE